MFHGPSVHSSKKNKKKTTTNKQTNQEINPEISGHTTKENESFSSNVWNLTSFTVGWGGGNLSQGNRHYQ